MHSTKDVDNLFGYLERSNALNAKLYTSAIPLRVIPSVMESNRTADLTTLCGKWWAFYQQHENEIFCLHCFIYNGERLKTSDHRCTPMNQFVKKCFDCLGPHWAKDKSCTKIGSVIKNFSKGWNGEYFCFVCSFPRGNFKHNRFDRCNAPFKQYISPAVHFIWEIEKLRKHFLSSNLFGTSVNLSEITSKDSYQNFLYKRVANTPFLGINLAFFWLMELITDMQGISFL
ncbi:hypothetical protein HK099_000231 [Clydaea vesicula]|uniref:Uncharacterized protein n=1 Tax=Clydaea vesicula TaxID=447962 RepID=A0AAD5U4M1_9FUNG|nr:hypothetical protein HK099_000231 [Clydaea vesicula]